MTAPAPAVKAPPCPTGCGRVVAQGKLMCRQCWARVPGDLQREVYATWRCRSRNLADTTKARAYREARDRALGAV